MFLEGQRVLFLVPSPCREEVTMKKILQFLAVMMCTAVASVSVQAQEARYVRVINETGATVEKIYVSHSSRSGWGRDQLGSQVLWSGYNIRVYPNDGTSRCVYDLKAVTVDGRSTERREVDICGGSEWTLYTRN